MFETNKKNATFTAFLLLLLFLVCACTGCATSQLTKTSTAVEKKSAICADAESALPMATLALSLAMPGTETVYWEKYIAGAQRMLDLNCK